MQLKYKIVIGVLCMLSLAFWTQRRPPHASVSLHGVNYSEREFSYFIADPDNPGKSMGGENIAPFAGGGTTCCASLPWKWKPGTKIRLSTIHWLEKRPDGSLPEVEEEHELDVPEYAEPEELWVIRDVNGKMSVVSSNVQPDHPNWPGKIKGWPAPSLEYQRERWALYVHNKKIYVETFISLLKELEADPNKRAQEAWNHAEEYSPQELKKFNDPKDPKYKLHLKNIYTASLVETEAELDELLRNKP